jgi:hypothetical protein
MLFLISYPPKPEAPHWPGRPLLAALDVVLWPAAWVAVAALAPMKTGVVGPFIIAVAVLCAVLRLHRAVGRNERYWFATCRWGKVLGALLLIGMVLKLAVFLGVR